MSFLFLLSVSGDHSTSIPRRVRSRARLRHGLLQHQHLVNKITKLNGRHCISSHACQLNFELFLNCGDLTLTTIIKGDWRVGFALRDTKKSQESIRESFR
eukprot:Selendium_serpulae@DN8708_c0_g1_i1.p1